MNKQELIEQLLSKIENQGIKIFCNQDLPIDAVVNIRKSILVFNLNKITPFKLAHELRHIINKDVHRGAENDAINPQEIRANKEAILLLWNLFLENSGNYEYVSLFVELTGCPFDLAYKLVSKEYCEQLDDFNEMDSNVLVDEDELKKYAIEYIRSFDVLDNIEVYRFLDLYHLAYSLYDKAVGVFCDLLHHDLKFGY